MLVDQHLELAREVVLIVTMKGASTVEWVVDEVVRVFAATEIIGMFGAT